MASTNKKQEQAEDTKLAAGVQQYFVPGNVSVTVFNPLGAGNTFTVDHQALSPAFFLFTAKYPAAVHLTQARPFAPCAFAKSVSLSISERE